MALQAKYKSFLASPTADALAENASVNYLPTLTTVNEPAAILKHLAVQAQQVKKQQENILNVVESEHNLCIETETTLQFVTGGGAYLPGLDENFLIDRTVTVPIVHIVAFNEEQKIRQVRQYWDQACILKAVDVIGARGRNWPVRDGKDQVKLIASSASSTLHAQPTPEPAVVAAPEEERLGRRQSRITADPYTSLPGSLFKAPEPVVREESPRNLVSPRASAKPAPRDMGELFVGGDQPASSARSQSPKKFDDPSNPLKSGAGKNYRENRLFEQEPTKSPEKSIKTNPNRYDHFEFGHADNIPPPTPAEKINTRHRSQWDFSDFDTPHKVRARKENNNSRHFSLAENENEEPKPNVWRQHVPKARPDSFAHFELTDALPPRSDAPKAARPKSFMQQMAAGVYENHISNDESSRPGSSDDPDSQNRSPPRGTTHNHEQYNKTFGSHFEITDENVPIPGGKPAPTAADEKMPLGNITNVNARHRDFEPHFDITDAPPAAAAKDENAGAQKPPSNKYGAKTFISSWDLYDSTLQAPPPDTSTKSISDGMGGRKTEEKSWWEF